MYIIKYTSKINIHDKLVYEYKSMAKYTIQQLNVVLNIPSLSNQRKIVKTLNGIISQFVHL